MGHCPAALPLAAALSLGAFSFGTSAHAQCEHLTRNLARRISTAATPQAPAWARPLITPTQLMRFDTTNFHALSYLLGYSAISLQRLGIGGARPYSATVVVRCRDLHTEVVSDPYAWANARARELHPVIDTAQKAVEYATEIAGLSTGRHPDSAESRRTGQSYRITLSLAPVQGDSSSAPQQLVLDVQHDGTVSVAQ